MNSFVVETKGEERFRKWVEGPISFALQAHRAGKKCRAEVVLDRPASLPSAPLLTEALATFLRGGKLA